VSVVGRYAAFFATKPDALDLLLYLEGRSPLVYVRWGHYDSPQAPTYRTGSDIPDLGTAEFGRKGDNRYLILPTRAALGFSKHKGSRGPTYEPRQRGYSPYVFFHSGGIYRDECLIAGEVWTAFETPDALRFYGRFYRALRTRFAFVKVTGSKGRQAALNRYIGPEALGLLRAGMRFSDGYASPPALDFKLPRGYRPNHSLQQTAGAGSGSEVRCSPSPRGC
jgi:hypothetical protein